MEEDKETDKGVLKNSGRGGRVTVILLGKRISKNKSDSFFDGIHFYDLQRLC